MSLGAVGGLGSDSTLHALAHTARLASLARAYPSTVDIEAATETQAANGEVVRAWAAVYRGLSGILAQNVARAGEFAREHLTVVSATHVLGLPGYYPAIDVAMRAKIARAGGDTAVYYDIVAVRHDSQAQTTRLELETVAH